MPSISFPQWRDWEQQHKFIINQNTQANGDHEIHNATQGCEHMPATENRFELGFFANSELAFKRAKMNWPGEKISRCRSCCAE